MQFGILCLRDKELCVAFIAEHTSSIGQPRHFDAVTDMQIVDANPYSIEGIALNISAFGQIVQICFPILIAEETRQETEGCAACSIRAINVLRDQSIAFDGAA